MCSSDPPYARARDQRVAALIAPLGATMHMKRGLVAVEPDELFTGSGTPYGVYTPYFRRWLEQGSSSVTWLQLAIAVGAIAIPIAAHHKVVPMDETQVLRMFHPQLAASVVPPAPGEDSREDTVPMSHGATAA